MDWSDVAETVGAMAPAAGGALAGPAGSAVGSVIARALGVANEPGAVAQALQEDPASALKLRRLEADLEATLIEGRTQAVTAEAKSESWLARSWRPLTMLIFVALIATHWLGLTSDSLTEGEVTLVLEIVKVGLGGYVVGRSAEKIVREGTGSGIFEFLKAKRGK